MPSAGDYLVGIEIGSDKTAILVAAPDTHGFEVLGFASVPTAGLKNGAVTSIPELSATVEKAVMEAESLSKKPIHAVHLSLFGDYFRMQKRQGELEIRSRKGEVMEDDRQAVIKKVFPGTSPEYEIIHSVIQEYLLDGRRQIKNPVGMFGQHLAINLFLISAAANRIKDLKHCLEEINLETELVTFAPLVAAEAVLTSEEMESGVAYLDFGRSATTVLIFNSTLREVESVGRGGARVNYALAYCLKTTSSEAERVKKEKGSCLMDVEPHEFTISDIQGEVRQTTNRREVAEIIEAELKDILRVFHPLLSKYRPMLTAGIVLGGGGALLHGLPELLAEELDVPVRIGTARQFRGWEKVLKDPAYNSLIGTVHAAIQYNKEKSQSSNRKPGVKKIFNRIKHLWDELF